MPENFKNFIAGEWVAPRTGAYFENRNPADSDDVIGCFPRSGPDDVARAVASAQRGFARWSKTPAPIRVAGLITPFNFPLAIPTWKMFPALLCGNAVIFKPAEDVPHTAHLLVEILLEAGLPPEVVQLVHGEGSVVGKAMVEHPEVPVVSFTGSTETGSVIGATCGRMHKRLSLEMGGKKAMIVMDDGDLDVALDGVLWGAFGTTGQRCTATSRLILHEKVHDKFVT